MSHVGTFSGQNRYHNTLIGFSQVTRLLMVFVAGWITDRVGQKSTMTVVLLAAGIATILIGLLDGGRLTVVIFVQPVWCIF